MTTDAAATNPVVSFFGGAGADDWRKRAAALQSNPAFAALAKAVGRYGDLMSWPSTFGQMAAKIPDLLRLDPSKLLVGAWAKGKEFQRYADPEQYPPEDTVLVKLARHVVRSSHEPQLEIKADDTLIDTVDFELTLAITIEGAVLEIRGGKIRRVKVGDCTASGELSCEGYTLAERKSEPFELPGEWVLDPPMPIVREA